MKTKTELWTFSKDLGLGVDASELIGYDVEATDGHIGSYYRGLP